MKLKIIILFFALFNLSQIWSQNIILQSPNGKIKTALYAVDSTIKGEWYLKVSYKTADQMTEIIPRINLGLSRSDHDFSKELRFLKATKPKLIKEHYELPFGKKSVRENLANEITVSFENPSKAKLNLIIRAYNDGITFRYEFPEKQGSYIINDEFTAYQIPKENKRWLEKWNPANEGLYASSSDDEILQQEWCYPALFNSSDKSSWFLLHEADLDRSYCGTKLSNTKDINTYKLTFPNQQDARGTGESKPKISLPWKSPWRVISIGSLDDIVESTLVDDVSRPTTFKTTNWIKPGKVSWNYWSSNHGTKDYKIVCDFADLAVEMNWPYTLLDWEWDAMTNGGNLEDALKYIHSKGIKPLMWYNSGGDHTWVSSTPKDRMLTHKNRVEEFTKLKKLGVAGVKVDFFESEKQDMINYYLDILEDAAQFEIMVYFHGCIVPRGWSRTYPNLMTYEAVRGAEWYNNGPEFSTTAPEHNTILPFTRNVVGAMDYTPVTFTNSQFPHHTSYGHELALSVLFESPFQHVADRPEGYNQLPDEAKNFLKEVPTTWDTTKLIDGYPGKDVIIARRKGGSWYIGGISASEREELTKQIKLDFLENGINYRAVVIADGKHDKAFSSQVLEVNKDKTIEVKLLRRGGFVISLIPIEK
ncbi:glycoside hydrolase family 97 protein [Flavobacterium sp. KACC 22761]|uniref:glycoside hydrolase family 97 protein n=1 Tax=Flavobacterium sp. KACC 22761 TaxID=3092665 RepID=UPI002A751C80|nr:glycoside hydrolase family 97 catalytic domain-containing protein [Flavobacterium sp. KACC 22761]WPO78250.1 glycoside hydrolase family 97 catalytic domain-containing protein [Flavobacterium sp. KACC 22761]